MNTDLASLALFRPDALFRPPDWRYRLARLLLDHPPAGRVWPASDSTVDFAVAVLSGAAVPARRRNAFARAEQLSQSTYPSPRLELEGRLLAGQTFAEVGRRCGLGAETVRLYHDLFFHVRDRLNQRHFVTACVLLRDGRVEYPLEESHLWLPHVGYRFGEYGVDALVEYLRGPLTSIPEDVSPLPDDDLRQLSRGLAVHAWLLAHSPGCDQLQEIALFQRLQQEVDALLRRRGATPEDARNVVAGLA